MSDHSGHTSMFKDEETRGWFRSIGDNDSALARAVPGLPSDSPRNEQYAWEFCVSEQGSLEGRFWF